jgi:hypothetical protein
VSRSTGVLFRLITRSRCGGNWATVKTDGLRDCRHAVAVALTASPRVRHKTASGRHGLTVLLRCSLHETASFQWAAAESPPLRGLSG